MNEASELRTDDEKIRLLIAECRRLIIEKKLRQDWRGDWISNNQLDALRVVLEKRGLNGALSFQAGKINRRGNRFELMKNEVLLDLLRYIKKSNLNLDLRVISYVIGKLNALVRELEKEDLE